MLSGEALLKIDEQEEPPHLAEGAFFLAPPGPGAWFPNESDGDARMRVIRRPG